MTEPRYGYGNLNSKSIEAQGNSLWVAFPLYYTVPVVWFANWLFMDKATIGGAVVSKGVYVNQAMEDLVSAALAKPGWQRLVIMEHDVVPPLGAFNRIAQYEPRHAIVGSMIFQHNHPHKPIMYTKVAQPDWSEYHEVDAKTVADMLDVPGLYEVGAVSFGFTSIARHVLEGWPRDSVKMFTPEVSGLGVPEDFASHDIWFCHHATVKFGHKVFVDSAIRCEHLTEVGINASHHRRVNTPELGELDGPPDMDIPVETFEII